MSKINKINCISAWLEQGKSDMLMPVLKYVGPKKKKKLHSVTNDPVIYLQESRLIEKTYL